VEKKLFRGFKHPY